MARLPLVLALALAAVLVPTAGASPVADCASALGTSASQQEYQFWEACTHTVPDETVWIRNNYVSVLYWDTGDDVWISVETYPGDDQQVTFWRSTNYDGCGKAIEDFLNDPGSISPLLGKYLP